MANYNVTIKNGTGSQAMKSGEYSVTATANGYDTTSLNPKTFTAGRTEGSQTFSLSANGTLTLNVNETGAVGGTPITSGTIIMTDSTGIAEYGSEVTIGGKGDAVFNNVPYGTSGEPFTLYFKQLTSDENHNIFDGIITISMISQEQTEYVQNIANAVQTFTLIDENYGMPISGTLNFTGTK